MPIDNTARNVVYLENMNTIIAKSRIKTVKIGNRLRDLLFRQSQTIIFKNNTLRYLGETYRFTPLTHVDVENAFKKAYKEIMGYFFYKR